jgi:hypothetical protein
MKAAAKVKRRPTPEGVSVPVVAVAPLNLSRDVA